MITLTDEWEIDQLVKTGLYPDRRAVLRDALRALYTVKPKTKLKLIASAYTDGQISIGKAAEMLGVSQEEAKDIFRDIGVSLHLGPETVAELRKDITSAR